MNINNMSSLSEKEVEDVVAETCSFYGTIKRLKIYPANGTLARPFALVDRETAGQANLLAATVEDPAAVNQVYNVAVNAKTTLNELFEMIRSLLEPRYPRLRDFRPVYRKFCAGDVPFSLGGIDKARRLLGYQPAWRIRLGLEQTIDWYVAKLAPEHSIHGGVPMPEAAPS